MNARTLTFCALLLTLVFPVSAVADEPALGAADDQALGQLPSTATVSDREPIRLDSASELAIAGHQTSEQLMSAQGGDESWLIGIQERPGTSCEHESCDVSVECWEGCESQWCNPWWNCDEENLCWCVRSCAEVCV